MKNKKVAIIGNSPAGNMLALLLKDKYDIVQILNSNTQKEFLPFYSNDLQKGILKQFCEVANVSFQKTDNYKIKIKLVYGKDKELCCDSSIDSFKSSIEKCFPQYKIEINKMFDDIKDIGEEWSTFIKNNFDPTACIMKKSAKYVGITLEKYIKKIGINDIVLQEILYTILPIRDATFPVFSGYLYTQFFDNHLLDENLWNKISFKANSIGKQINLQDYCNILVKREDDSSPDVIENNIDCIVDLRCPDFLDKSAENTNKWEWGGYFFTTELDDSVIYCLRVDEGVYLRLWKSLYITDRKANQWQFEFIVNENTNNSVSEVVKLVEKQIREFLGVGVKIEEHNIYDPMYFKDNFDCSYGYMWAFNLKQAMKDPTNLFSRQKSSYIKSGYWGFAWFSEAFCIYNSINKQVEWKGMYKIVQENEKKG